ncbi:MAG: hypothetical protein ACR2NZ_22170 [Rubripirellula sp.]
MRFSSAISVFVIICLMMPAKVSGLSIPYGKTEISQAGPGCIGGWKSDHGETAYFCGDTEMLHAYLQTLAKRAEHPVTVVLHAGSSRVDAPEETRQLGFGLAELDDNQIEVDWSVVRACPFEGVRSGKCRCDDRRVTVHVQIAERIRLEKLAIPREFRVEPAGDIDEFIKRHDAKK